MSGSEIRTTHVTVDKAGKAEVISGASAWQHVVGCLMSTCWRKQARTRVNDKRFCQQPRSSGDVPLAWLLRRH